MEDKLRELSIKYVIAIALGLPILYYFFYFEPPNQLKTIADYEQQLVEIDAEIKKLEKEIIEGEQFKVDIEVIKKEIRTLASYLEVKPDSKTIEQIISDEARATGISFTSLQPVNEQYTQPAYLAPGEVAPILPSDFIKRNLIEASFTGTFIELMRFLSYLSRAGKVISLKEIQLRSNNYGSTSKSKISLEFKATFETYSIIKDVNAEDLVPDVQPAVVEGQAPQ